MKLIMKLIDEYAEIQRNIGDSASDENEFLEAADRIRSAIAERAEYLAVGAEYRNAMGSVRDIRVGPPGAVFAMENLKNAEKNAKNPNYIPPWNPGKINSADATDEDLTEVLKNPQLTPTIREWLKTKERLK